jgi:hypothetical protein
VKNSWDESFSKVENVFWLKILILEFWIQGPKSWDGTCQVQQFAPYTKQRDMVKGREGRFATWLRTCYGKKAE